MAKDYKKWHKLKSRIDQKGNAPLFQEREIWWCSVGVNVGIESDGKNVLFERPILIVRKFNKEMLWALPLTSRLKNSPFYKRILLERKERSVLLSQLRVVSAKRLTRKISKIGKKQFEIIKSDATGFLK